MKRQVSNMVVHPKILPIILAGGEGKRLMPPTSDRAKPAVSFGDSCRPIDFTPSNFVNSGSTQVAVLTRYKSRSLDRHTSMTWQFSTLMGAYVTPVPAQQCLGPRWYQGSADTIYQSLNLIRDASPDYVVVFDADNIYRMNIEQMADAHIDPGLGYTIVGIRIPRSETNALDVIDAGEDKRIEDFLEKPTELPGLPDLPKESFASMDNYIFSRHALVEALRADAKSPATRYDISGDIVPWFIAQGQSQVYDFKDNVVPGTTGKDLNYWRDVGIVDVYHKAYMDLVSVEPELNLYNSDWPLLTNQSQAPGAKFAIRGEAEDSIVNPGCIIPGGEVDRTVLDPNVCIDKWSQVSDFVLMDGVNVGHDVAVCRAILDKHMVVTDGAQIDVDHDHDREHGFRVSPNGVVAVGKDTVVPWDQEKNNDGRLLVDSIRPDGRRLPVGGLSVLDRHRQAVAHREQSGGVAVGGPYRVEGFADDDGFVILPAGVGDDVISEHVVDDRETARTQQAQGGGHVLDVLQFVAVDEYDVIGIVPQLREDFQGSACDQPVTGRRIAHGVGERPYRQPVIDLEVNTGQRSVGGHPGEQGQGEDAQCGTDLSHSLRIHGLDQHGEGGDHTLTDRGEPGLNRLHPGLLKIIGDGGVGLSEAPALCRRRRDERISCVSRTATPSSSILLSVETLF